MAKTLLLSIHPNLSRFVVSLCLFQLARTIIRWHSVRSRSRNSGWEKEFLLHGMLDGVNIISSNNIYARFYNSEFRLSSCSASEVPCDNQTKKKLRRFICAIVCSRLQDIAPSALLCWVAATSPGIVADNFASDSTVAIVDIPFAIIYWHRRVTFWDEGIKFSKIL